MGFIIRFIIAIFVLYWIMRFLGYLMSNADSAFRVIPRALFNGVKKGADEVSNELYNHYKKKYEKDEEHTKKDDESNKE